MKRFCLQIIVNETEMFTNMPEWGPDIMRRLRFVTLQSGSGRADFYAYYFKGDKLHETLNSIPKVQSSKYLKTKLPFLESNKLDEKCQ